MSVALIASVAGLAMEHGPAVLRGIGSMFGGKTAEVTEDLARSVEYVDGAVNGQAARQQKLEQMVAGMPPEALVELEQIKLALEQEQTRRQELAYQDRQTGHHETQTTIREGDRAEDDYVRHTRPWGCRITLYAGIVYILVMELASAFEHGTGASWEFATIFFSPFMTYLGWRTMDKRGYTQAIKQGLNTLNPLAKQGGR